MPVFAAYLSTLLRRTPRKILFCCVRFLYILSTIQARAGSQDPTPLFVQGAAVYVHIRYGAFVALEIYGGVIMRVFRYIRVLFECYRIGKWLGVRGWFRYLFGQLELEENAQKVADFYLGG